MNKRAQFFVGLTIASGVCLVAYCLAEEAVVVPSSAYLVAVLLALLASTLKVHLPGITGTISVNFLLILIAVAVFSFAETVLLASLACILQRLSFFPISEGTPARNHGNDIRKLPPYPHRRSGILLCGDRSAGVPRVYSSVSVAAQKPAADRAGVVQCGDAGNQQRRQLSNLTRIRRIFGRAPGATDGTCGLGLFRCRHAAGIRRAVPGAGQIAACRVAAVLSLVLSLLPVRRGGRGTRGRNLPVGRVVHVASDSTRDVPCICVLPDLCRAGGSRIDRACAAIMG